MGLLPSRRNTRLRHVDYTSPGNYFVTICANGRRCLFADVSGDVILPGALGKLVVESWLAIPIHHTCVELDEFVLMPNHIHGILRITDAVPRQSLSTIVSCFKASVTRAAKLDVWQPRYYEHIVRSTDDLERIRGYIRDNPIRWEEDPDNFDVRRLR